MIGSVLDLSLGKRIYRRLWRGWQRPAPAGELTSILRPLPAQPPAAPRVFAVVSWGCAATHWLARVLNSHPDILCLHHVASQIRYITGQSDPVDYRRIMLVLQGSGQGHALVGDVHGVDTISAQTLIDWYGDGFRCVCLLRDPVPRLASNFAMFELFATRAPGMLDQFTNSARRLACYEKLAHRLASPERLFFVHCAQMLNSVLHERQLATIYRMEDVTRSPAVLRRLIDELSAGTVAATESFAQAALTAERSHSHRKGRNFELADWQLEVLQHVVAREAWLAYADLGYRVEQFL
jgi:hypothetical protein